MDRQAYAFTENGARCIIFTHDPPRHWYNYLWNDDGYCAQISQMGHGRSYTMSEKADMCAINSGSARYLYLRDDESGASWNVGREPLGHRVENFRCEHGISDTVLSSACQGIEATWRLFVPPKGFHEVWTLTLHNTDTRARDLSIFLAVTFSLEGFAYPRYYEMYRCMETSFDEALGGVFCAATHPFAPHARYNAFLASSASVHAYDGDLAKFCGTGSTLTLPDASVEALFQRPRVVVEGLDCTNSDASLFVLGGVLQNKLTLAPGATQTLHFAFGTCESIEEARLASQSLRDSARIEATLKQVRAADEAKYAVLSLRTPDERINNIMNAWVQKQVDFCIVGKKGVRDNLQVACGLLNFRPDVARREVLECLAHQFRDGHAVLTWYPYDDTRYSDQPFWIIWAVCELIKETNEFSILEQVIPWQDGGEAMVLEHVRAAVTRLIEDKGPNGLVRLYFADWNDALNITTDANAESVMLSHQFCLALKELQPIMARYGLAEYAAELGREYEKLKDCINRNAWDGDWYVRALTKDGPIGGKHSEGSTIYLNAQTWAVLGGVVPEERLAQVVRSVDGMAHDFGFPLNLPPYDHYQPEVGRMSGMLPGLFENGGVYCHATGFKLLMDCALGRADEALKTLQRIMPDSEKNPSTSSGAEPYVFTNCYATHPKYYGRSYQSWTTGTSAWCLKGIYEGILGLKHTLDGLQIAPCFPSCWERAEVTRRFRGADYHIILCNPDRVENGSPEITVDGRLLSGNVLPVFGDGKVHEVAVVLR